MKKNKQIRIKDPLRCLVMGLLTVPLALAQGQHGEQLPADPQGEARAAPVRERAAGPRDMRPGPQEAPRSARQDDAGIQELLSGFDLASGVWNWKGKSFNLGDAEMARARFERYLNAPPATGQEDLEYNRILEEINMRLIGRGGGTEATRVAEAWRMLYQASTFPIDSGLSETLADRVVSFWQTSQKIQRLLLENERLEQERSRSEINMRVIQNRDRREFIDMTRGVGGGAPPSMDYLLEPERKRLEETERQISENRSFEVTSRINQKLEFQSMILQFFIQRRFQHTLIANTFYRYIFSAEDNTLEGAEALKGQIFGDLDVKITTSTIDALAKEALADVHESIRTVDFLLERGEVHMATQRLMEAFYLGEYLPPVKTFPLDKKRQVLSYLRDLGRLSAALEMKNFDRAADILGSITEYAVDFDPGRPEAFITTSRQLSDLAVQKAMAAAYDQDRAGVDAALQEAVLLWPTNPRIQGFSQQLLDKTDIRDLAGVDFDRLVRQKDFRAVFNDRFRFAAALAMDPARNEEFLGIMKRMEQIESALAQARELARTQNTFGAWEVLERVYRIYPEDQELNRLRGDYAVRASAFASAVAKAEDANKAGDYSKALFAYLEARELYPPSYFAQQGIQICADNLFETRNATE